MCQNDVINQILMKWFCHAFVEIRLLAFNDALVFMDFGAIMKATTRKEPRGERKEALKFLSSKSRFDAERKKLMSIAGIEQVRAAEAEADRIRKSAEDEAAALVANSKREARKLVEDAEAAAQQEYKDLLAKAAKEADVLYENRTEEERKTCEEIKAAAGEHLPEAVAKIVGKVVGTYGNS